jgi:hypothetical protein
MSWKTLEACQKLVKMPNGQQWQVGFIDERLSIWQRGGKIKIIRDAVHEAGIDDHACAK